MRSRVSKSRLGGIDVKVGGVSGMLSRWRRVWKRGRGGVGIGFNEVCYYNKEYAHVDD